MLILGALSRIAFMVWCTPNNMGLCPTRQACAVQCEPVPDHVSVTSGIEAPCGAPFPPLVLLLSAGPPAMSSSSCFWSASICICK